MPLLFNFMLFCKKHRLYMGLSGHAIQAIRKCTDTLF